MISTPYPIFTDRMVRTADYAFCDGLLVTKIFATIQGEGPFAGQRAVFVRLAGCNLGGKGVNGPGCSFCDTDFRYARGAHMPIESVIQGVLNCHPAKPGKVPPQTSEGPALVVITGGEPMLQSNLVKFLEQSPPCLRFQIESNGTLLLNIPNTTFLVVSPKVVESVYHLGKGKYYIPTDAVLSRANALKFVVSANPNSPYHDVPEYAQEFPGLVYVSPMAVYRPGVESPNKATASIWDSHTFDQGACAKNHARAAELAMKYGYTMTTQMHLYCGVE